MCKIKTQRILKNAFVRKLSCTNKSDFTVNYKTFRVKALTVTVAVEHFQGCLEVLDSRACYLVIQFSKRL